MSEDDQEGRNVPRIRNVRGFRRKPKIFDDSDFGATRIY